jgi:quercetin dioxygenase-like cupin family protein
MGEIEQVISQWRSIMKITHLGVVDKIRMTMEGAKDTWKQSPISTIDGTPTASLRVFTIMPGGHTPYHIHAFEHMNYIIEGEGALVMENGDERPLNKGDFALVMPGEKHQYKNRSSNNPMVMICVVPKEYE